MLFSGIPSHYQESRNWFQIYTYVLYVDSPILKGKRKADGDLAHSYLGSIQGFVHFTSFFSSIIYSQ